jgi:hypothetical protein
VQFQFVVVAAEARPTHLGHQVRIGVAPGLACRQVAARQAHRLEGAHALRLPVVGEQELAAPEAAVLAHADAVERDAEHLAAVQRPAVLAQARRDVRMVVADADLSVGPALLRELRRGITRVQIAGDEIGLEGVELEVVSQRAPLVGQAGGVV